MKEIKAYLAPAMAQVENTITAALSSDVQLLDQTNKSLREHPGKMLRPMLTSDILTSDIDYNPYLFVTAIEVHIICQIFIRRRQVTEFVDL